MQAITRIRTITEYHRSVGLPPPEHPLVSLIDYAQVKHESKESTISLVLDFYSIAMKRNIGGKMRYGQQEYDFDEGVMSFIAPGQVFRIELDPNAPSNRSGYLLQVHPDFLWNTPLASTIRHYEYFGYAVNEALFLSDKEEKLITDIFLHIRQEYHSNIDRFSQDVIIAQLELLLKYADRFYHRQFLTRKIGNHRLLSRLEQLLDDYFRSDKLLTKGLPVVQEIAAELHTSPNYLSNLLKVLTGQSTQQHIHNKLIEKAKEQLSTTNKTVSEIAYELGFEHSQSFSKLFKSKTKLSPLAFRQSFN